MTQPAKPETTVPFDEKRLANALVSRGLLTREELKQARAPGPADSAETMLDRLVRAGVLTPPQARRTLQELPTLMGQQIPGYQLLERLGQGSMGVVYKSRQLSMNRLVAVKVLSPRLAADPEFLKRFTREAHLAARLSHNNIVQAIDVGSAGKVHFFIMEFVEGTSIREELDKGKIYSEREALEIIVQVAQALQHAHRRKLIHRDVKPANVMLTPEGIAKLADLGLARETAGDALADHERGKAIGTPYYMAPEQIRAEEDVDGRADIYSLGATLYHMVTGHPPFPEANIEAVLDAHLHRELTPPDHLNQTLSAGLGEVVEFAMAKNRRDRYRNPDDLILDLECLLNGEPPKLARQHIAASTLQQLAAGEVEEEEEPRPAGVPVVWVAVLAGGLALSLLANLILLLSR
jgi:eukaryotic-like serine/threonine-protein kinase